MKVSVSVTSIYHSSLERVFKTPILCDVTKVHTGFGFMPRVTHCTDDESWGQPGSTKKVFVQKSLVQKGGFASIDRVIDRVDNKYWKIEVTDFQSWLLGFTKFVGEWETTEIGKDQIQVVYTYTLHSDVAILFPLNWLFAKLFWRVYMKQVMENIAEMIRTKEPYWYE